MSSTSLAYLAVCRATIMLELSCSEARCSLNIVQTYISIRPWSNVKHFVVFWSSDLQQLHQNWEGVLRHPMERILYSNSWSIPNGRNSFSHFCQWTRCLRAGACLHLRFCLHQHPRPEPGRCPEDPHPTRGSSSLPVAGVRQQLWNRRNGHHRFTSSL